MTWPDNRGAIDSVNLQMRVRTPSGRMHAVVRELVAENLGVVDSYGELIPVTGPARFVRQEPVGKDPWTMRITHVEVEGDAALPHTITIHGVTMEAYLDLLPCPSNPLTWDGEYTRFTRDWVGPEGEQELFAQPRDLSSCTMIAVADGASVDGDSDVVIHRLIKESIDAVHRVCDQEVLEDGPIYVALLAERKADAHRLIIRPTDQTLWKEIGDAALAYGVGIRADLWLPEQPQPVPDLILTAPTIIFTVRQEA
ncbi:hypothetical protein [Corynebacterium callunae]|uniref:hypothetical protein n=1 Tax=Corynebacterium callunae TaxID=1721 RepID=UPI001FFEC89E|nr:hypothetical protein [Corynebacterium callunae]MCK2199202.1 hypothetical protein [Corynebacterium callunae]